MNKKEYNFLEQKLDELVENHIISIEQLVAAREYFDSKVKKGKSAGTILAGIGVLLIALSIITLFAVNWDTLSREVKCGIAFLPIVITAVMMFFCMDGENRRLIFYTSIFAPASILATNSLIGQVFHIQTEIYQLIFTSLIMFLPIAFVLRNYLAMLVYSVGAVLYACCAMDGMSEQYALISTFVITLPMIIYNIFNYRKDKTDKKNTLLWVANVILITLLLLCEEIIRPESIFIYLYLVYAVSVLLFEKENGLNRILSVGFGAFLLISCINAELVSYAGEITFGWDTLIITVLAVIAVYFSKLYRNPNEYILMALILLIQYFRLPEDILFLLINVLALVWGSSKIVSGNKEGDIKLLKRGIAIVLYLIFIRFMNADLGFMEKSVIFLISGIGFIIGSKVLEKKLGGKNDE